MPFNINTFKSQGLTYGGSRPSLFNITMSVPAGLGINTASVQKFSFVCRAGELPASTIGSVPVGYFGRKIKLKGDRTFQDWNVTVMNDEDFAVRSMFEVWSNAMNRMESNVMDPALYNETYKTDFFINKYSKDGEMTRQYRMVGAWPGVIGAIAQDWDSVNTVESFPVSFSYDYWEPSVESSSKSAGGINTYIAQAKQDGPLGGS